MKLNFLLEINKIITEANEAHTRILIFNGNKLQKLGSNLQT